ncbi:unnamed protein product [Peniophora sp. CBMAI 1063]|nr:unnamed protein product [Peniophora sp. CBMAI 1063]
MLFSDSNRRTSLRSAGPLPGDDIPNVDSSSDAPPPATAKPEAKKNSSAAPTKRAAPSEPSSTSAKRSKATSSTAEPDHPNDPPRRSPLFALVKMANGVARGKDGRDLHTGVADLLDHCEIKGVEEKLTMASALAHLCDKIHTLKHDLKAKEDLYEGRLLAQEVILEGAEATNVQLRAKLQREEEETAKARAETADERAQVATERGEVTRERQNVKTERDAHDNACEVFHNERLQRRKLQGLLSQFLVLHDQTSIDMGTSKELARAAETLLKTTMDAAALPTSTTPPSPPSTPAL